MSKKEIYKDDEVGCLQYEIFDDTIYIHCDVYQWSPDKYKEMVDVWCSVLDDIRHHHVTAVYAISPDKKAVRWASMFGFYPIGEVVSPDNEIHTLLERKV